MNHAFLSSFLRLNQQEEQVFRAEVDKLEETMQEGVMTIITSWAEQGAEEEARSLVLRLLARKVGELPQLVRLQIDPLSTTQLEALGEALLDFSSLSDLETWLAE